VTWRLQFSECYRIPVQIHLKSVLGFIQLSGSVLKIHPLLFVESLTLVPLGLYPLFCHIHMLFLYKRIPASVNFARNELEQIVVKWRITIKGSQVWILMLGFTTQIYINKYTSKLSLCCSYRMMEYSWQEIILKVPFSLQITSVLKLFTSGSHWPVFFNNKSV